MPRHDVETIVKKVIEVAKNRGYVTFDELNDVLPSDQTSPEEIEDIMARVTEVGIDIVETDGADRDEDEGR
jgi:RNA polymerase primary sigma factor